jgi:hypothetical protein
MEGVMKKLSGLVVSGLLVLLFVWVSDVTAHDYPRLVKVKVGEETTFRVSDAGSCSATIWVDSIENESLFSINPDQGEGISVEFTVSANETPGETTIIIQWVGEDVGSDEGSCQEDTRESGGVSITIRVTPDKVNSVGDAESVEPGDGHCDTGNNIEVAGEDVPECTLRAAIQEINAEGWEPNIEFDIQGAAPHTIALTTSLPPVEKSTIISTRLGAGSKVGTYQSLTPPSVVILGTASFNHGLNFVTQSSGSIVEGLAILGFGLSAVKVDTDDIVIRSNYIGTDPGGSTIGNEFTGIMVSNAVGTLIGGESADYRNIVVGNEFGVFTENSSQTIIIGNWFGLMPDSTEVFANSENSIRIQGGANNGIGGSTEFPGTGRGNIIVGGRDGINISSNETLIRGNLIGDATDPTDTPSPFRLTGSGIRIGGNTAIIGGDDELESNTIGHVDGSGIYVYESATRAITIRKNSIFATRSLGIDLEIDGVNENDSLDVDQGANDLINYPVLDSIKTAEGNPSGGTVHVFGSLESSPSQTVTIDVYLNGQCNMSGYGEGKIWLGSTSATTDATGKGVFQVSFVSSGDKEYDRENRITATATDGSGNTSEFSECDARKILIVDVDDKPIKNKTFGFSKVTNNPPVFTETFIDSLTTDDDGYVNRDSLGLENEELLLIRKVVHTKPSAKGSSLTKNMLTVTLDNIQIDPGGIHNFLEIDDDLSVQKATMNHTVIGYNLAISIEWWASREYVQQMTQSLRLGSDYLYNVSDGQMKLDTISISVNKLNWNNADARYHAKNIQWPVANIDGILSSDSEMKIWMPRRWYGNKDRGRNSIVSSETDLDLTNYREYRTFIHEFGHYGLGIYDEYEFVTGSRCAPGHRYGFMDNHYEGGFLSNEMSWSHVYPEACRNTNQYVNRGKGGFEYIQDQFEKTYGGIKVPILIPSERGLSAGIFHFDGPNNIPGTLNYSTGSRVFFFNQTTQTPKQTRVLFVADSDGNPVPDARLMHISTNLGRVIEQGNTSDTGQIAVLGSDNNDRFLSTGRVHELSVNKTLTLNDTIEWLSGTLESDSDTLQLQTATGIFPIIPDVRLNSTGFEALVRTVVNPLSLPDVSMIVGDQITEVNRVPTENGLVLPVVTDTSLSGVFQIDAMAPNQVPVLVFVDFDFINASSDSVFSHSNSAGDFKVNPQQPGSAFRRGLIVSSDFPVPTVGLEPDAIQVSNVFGLDLEKTNSDDQTSISIRYTHSDLSPQQQIDMIKVFRWDLNEERWKQIGGQVDTTHFTVTVSTTETGVFAAFTSSSPTSVIEDTHELPKQNQLHQNYPNPFNPSTTISFDVAEMAHVKLVVYDVLGREITTLVNNSLSPGRYNSQFNINALASGVYLYRIQIGDYYQTKTMLLIK